jgi:enoyl-CoA hydratase
MNVDLEALETKQDDNYQQILVDRDGPAFVITINRMEKYNSHSNVIRQELADAIRSVRDDKTIRGIIVWGGTHAFGTGADITELLQAGPLDVFGGFADYGNPFADLVSNCPQVVIAAIAGPTFGGALEVAMACDLRIAADNAQFAQPEVTVGMLPGGGATQRLTRLIGIGRAKEMILLGDTIRAEQALQYGLVNKVVPAAGLLNEAKAWVQRIAEVAPIGVRLAKLMIDYGEDVNLRAGLIMESLAFGAAFSTNDMREGSKAFLDKRKPNFTGT